MKWSEAVREEPMKIWKVWNEEERMSSYWSTEDRALTEISRLSGFPKDQLEFKEEQGEVFLLLDKDGWWVDPTITLSVIELDTGRYE